MSIFKLDINPDEFNKIENEIQKRVNSLIQTKGDLLQKENDIASSVLNYASKDVEDLSYELFRAREYVKIFPENDPFSNEKISKFRRFYHRIVRRLLRQQIVFNEFILSASEEIWKKLHDLEERFNEIEKNQKDKGSGHGNA